MNAKCTKCETLFLIERGKCPSCQNTAGYLQEPQSKYFSKLVVKLEDVLIHKKSNNQFLVKEIQSKGLLCLLKSSPIGKGVVGKKCYISDDVIDEYRVLR